MVSGKNQAILFSVSLLLGIVLSIRSLTRTKEEEENIEVKLARLEERVSDLEEA
tara:strand:- start:241 stop:402 length:162 start_codon:yes stop_codon:yes gene_type:complete